ncbi:MAG: heme biosynthesis protein HemY [Chromatiales bacterium]|nr:heme biosynthesis protein HemY [Chromatiales bacterium]
MRVALWSLVALVVAGLLVTVLRAENGYVLISVGAWVIETSVAMLVIAIAVLWVIANALGAMIARVTSVPVRMRLWTSRRQLRQAQRDLNRGLMALAEGRWSVSEHLLQRSAPLTESPLIGYLAAARAAQQQAADARRDQYLKQALKSMPEAELAVGLTQAELQMAGGRTEQALATLMHLRALAPRHDYVLKLLVGARVRLGDWDGVAELLPELRKRDVLPVAELDDLSARLELDRLAHAGTDPAALDAVWAHIGKAQRQDARVVERYASALAEGGVGDAAERVLRAALDRRWEPTLLALYARLPAGDFTQQLSTVERWLEARPEDPALLLLAGRLAMRNRLWGKARSYLEASLGARESAEACHELGLLLERLGEPDRAREYLVRGLAIANGGMPVAALADIGVGSVSAPKPAAPGGRAGKRVPA